MFAETLLSQNSSLFYVFLLLGDPAGTHLSPSGNGSDSRLNRGWADTYPAPAAHPQIHLRFCSADAWIPPPDHPITLSASCVSTPSLRVLACPAEPSGCGCGGRASGTGDGYINTVQRHAPAFLAFDVSRSPPVTRPLMHLAPVRPLSGSIFGAGLFCGIGAAVVREAHILHIIARRPKKGRR
ncbi:MAG: hypothetical protein WCJ02_13300 [bacterium]